MGRIKEGQGIVQVREVINDVISRCMCDGVRAAAQCVWYDIVFAPDMNHFELILLQGRHPAC